jgi:hypothetical protein
MYTWESLHFSRVPSYAWETGFVRHFRSIVQETAHSSQRAKVTSASSQHQATDSHAISHPPVGVLSIHTVSPSTS